MFGIGVWWPAIIVIVVIIVVLVVRGICQVGDGMFDIDDRD